MKEHTGRNQRLLQSLSVITLVLYWHSPGIMAAPRGMSALDMVELHRISDPVLSPDGSEVLYLRSEVNWEENDVVKRFRVSSPETGETVAVIEPAEPAESFNKAVWLPSGGGVLTALKRDDDEYAQVYVFDFSDETVTRVTEHHQKVEDITVMPQGGGFLFRADSASTASDRDDHWVIDEYESKPVRELWYVEWASRESRMLLGGDFDVRSYVVSRDGSRVLYVRAASALQDEQDRELWIHDIETGQSEQVTDNAFVESGAVLSPDNSRVAYIATVNERGQPYFDKNVFIQQIDGGETTLLLPKNTMAMLEVEWNAAGTGLFILGNDGVRTHLYHYDLRTMRLDDLTPGDHVIKNWTYNAPLDTHVFVKTSALNPGEVWVMANGDQAARQASFEYADLAERFTLPRQTVYTWRGRGAVTLEGILVYPLDYHDGDKVPLVTITHGGPRSSSQFGSWNMSRHVPVLAVQGYAVFLPNHRGGAGYGDRFIRDMVGRYFNNAHHDVLDGVDALVDDGLADPEQLVVMGWSAGGHMTNKLITVTDRFRVASSGAGVSDWVSLYGESDVRHNRTPWFGGAPWTKRAPTKNYASQSLLKDAWRVTTPTLFFVGEKDVRVPPTQSIMMYRAAKAAGAEAELYIAPGQKHQFSAPSYRLFKINRDLEWFAKHLGRSPYAPVFPAAKDAPAE